MREAAMNESKTPNRHGPLLFLLGAIAGAAVGFGVAWVIYVSLVPVLEDRDDWLRELQGFLWNVVPLLTVGGAVLGWWFVRARRDRGR